MSNDTEVKARLWNLQTTINKMIQDKVRDPHKVAEIYQSIVNEPNEVTKVVPMPFLRSTKSFPAVVVSAAVGPLLEYVGEVTIPTNTANFMVGEMFKLKKNGGVFAYFNADFEDQFLSGEGKVEEPTGGHKLHYMKLCRGSANSSIIHELGGLIKSETTMADIYYLHERQLKGEKGFLLTGLSNIFFVRDRRAVLCVIRTTWRRSDGWGISMRAVKDVREWSDAGHQVFSPNSVSVPSKNFGPGTKPILVP